MVTINRLFYHLIVMGCFVFFAMGCSGVLGKPEQKSNEKYPLKNSLSQELFANSQVKMSVKTNLSGTGKCYFDNEDLSPPESFRFQCKYSQPTVTEVNLSQFVIGENKMAIDLKDQYFRFPIYLSSDNDNSRTATLSVPINQIGKKICISLTQEQRACTKGNMTVERIMRANKEKKIVKLFLTDESSASNDDEPVSIDLVTPDKNNTFAISLQGEGNSTSPAKLSIPNQLIDNKDKKKVCLLISPVGTKACTAEPITAKIIKDSTKKVQFVLAGESLPPTGMNPEPPTPEGPNPTTTDKLIVVAISKKFDQAKIATTLKSKLTEWSKSQTQKKFTLVIIDSGRELTVDPSLDQLNRLGFATEDLKAADDLELIDDLITEKVKKILYFTGNDGLGQEIPRNQCIALAWQRDGVELHVVTIKKDDCKIWEQQGVKGAKCRSLLAKPKDFKDSIEAIFNDFIQSAPGGNHQ